MKDEQGRADAHQLCYPQGRGSRSFRPECANGSTGEGGQIWTRDLLAALWFETSKKIIFRLLFVCWWCILGKKNWE